MKYYLSANNYIFNFLTIKAETTKKRLPRTPRQHPMTTTSTLVIPLSPEILNPEIKTPKKARSAWKQRPNREQAYKMTTAIVSTAVLICRRK